MDIKLAQSQSSLQRLLSEVLSSLSDERINSLAITGVKLARGKYHADVFLLDDDLSEFEKKEILRALKNAKGHIKSQVLALSGWFKSPNFNFKFDKSYSEAMRIDSILNQIKQDL